MITKRSYILKKTTAAALFKYMWPFQWTPETKGLSTPAGSLLWWGGKCFWAGILRFVNQSLSILNILSITTHNFLQAIVDIIWLLPSPFQILWSCGYEWISEFFFFYFSKSFSQMENTLDLYVVKIYCS